jgi:hypothetical protein
MSLIPQRKKSTEEIAALRDQLGILRVNEAPPLVAEVPLAASAPPLASPPSSRVKPVRSLRRSEREPVVRAVPAVRATSHSRLPARRHSANELQTIRRRDALVHMDPSGKSAMLVPPAPPWVVIAGYGCTFFGLACHAWQIPITATAGAVLAALAIAVYICVWRPLSRHHAGFIGILTVVILFFSVLHYFPHLRHAS